MMMELDPTIAAFEAPHDCDGATRREHVAPEAYARAVSRLAGRFVGWYAVDYAKHGGAVLRLARGQQ